MNLHALRDFFLLLAERFASTRGPQVAGSLAFTTLLALVPLITVTLTVFGNLPGMDQIGDSVRSFLLQNLLPERAGHIIATYALQFSEQAGRLTLIGIGLLVLTSLMLLGTIEQAFNHIWGVRRPRRMLTRITVGWFVLTLGPILFGASVIGTGYVISTSMTWSNHLPWIGEFTARLLPPLLLCALFGFLYYAVPNHPVRIPHAIVGALVAALVFFLMQRAFGLFIARFPSYTLIFGTFAALPIFLVWLYLSWSVILLGALITATLPAYLERRRLAAPFAGDEAWAATEILCRLARAQRHGRCVDAQALVECSALPPHRTDGILERLQEAGWVARTEEEGWVLRKAPDSIRMRDVVTRFALDLNGWRQAAPTAHAHAFALRLDRSLDAGDLSLAELLQLADHPADAQIG